MRNKITADTTLAEILKLPKAEKILAKYNLPCLGCPFAKLEIENLKIGEVCKMYEINLEKLLRELNEPRPSNKRSKTFSTLRKTFSTKKYSI